MKDKISITVDHEVLELIENMVKDEKGLFRNRSHVVEYSVKKLLEEKRRKEKWK